MSTSRTGLLFKPRPGERVPTTAFAYLRSRAKRHAYDLVMREFKRSGITKAELARRLGKSPAEVSRMLGGPANWTIQTVSDLLFAISAGEPTWGIAYPLDRPARNDTRPEWATDLRPFAVTRDRPKIYHVAG